MGTPKFVNNEKYLLFFFCIYSPLLLHNHLWIILKTETKQVVLLWYIFISSNRVISNSCHPWSFYTLPWQVYDTVFIWKVTSRSNIENLCQIGLVKSLMFTRCQMENILRHFLLNKGLAPPSCKSEDASSKQMLSTLALILCFVFSLQFVSLGSTEITGQPWTCVQLRQSTQSEVQESCWISWSIFHEWSSWSLGLETQWNDKALLFPVLPSHLDRSLSFWAEQKRTS